MNLEQHLDEYPTWALSTFHDRIAPVLTKQCAVRNPTELAWLNTCQPDEGEVTRYRLFPGSLYLLWIQALSGEESEDHAPIAATLECLHNASLHHDDVLDQHDSRRGVDTMRSASGSSGSLLAGDGLIGFAFKMLSTIKHYELAEILGILAEAWSQMNRGQFMDEAMIWRTIPTTGYRDHWEIMTRNKLALGNYTAVLAATCLQRHDITSSLLSLHEDFSLVSQILNDIGDQEGWAGFHAISLCKREPGHEAKIKPTLASIWKTEMGLDGKDHQQFINALFQRAYETVGDITSEALTRLRQLNLEPDAKNILQDFFNRPLRELKQIDVLIRKKC